MIYFKGKNINLIAFEKKHIEMVRDWINDENMTYLMGTKFPVSSYEQEIWYEKNQNDKTKKKLIIENNQKEYVGMISIFNIDYQNQKTEIGIYIIPKYQKRKYAKESIMLMLKFVFNEMNINKVYALIRQDNIISINFFKSINFNYESVDKQSVYSLGKFIDIVKYSIFKRDFVNNIGFII